MYLLEKLKRVSNYATKHVDGQKAKACNNNNISLIKI